MFYDPFFNTIPRKSHNLYLIENYHWIQASKSHSCCMLGSKLGALIKILNSELQDSNPINCLLFTLIFCFITTIPPHPPPLTTTHRSSCKTTFLLFTCQVISSSLRPHGLPHTRLPCPSPSPGACSNTCPLSHAIQPSHCACEYK